MEGTLKGCDVDYQLIRAYCAKDLDGILKPYDKWYSMPASRWAELESQILLNHRTGARYLEPRQYAAAVCLSALERLAVPFQANEDYPEFTQADSDESRRVFLANALNDYVLHLSASEAAPLLALVEEQNTATPARLVTEGAPDDGDKGGWVTQAISRGWAIILEAGGRWFPTQKDLAKQIEREFREAIPPILNMHGQPLETSTIERELKRNSVSCKQARAKANLNIQGN